MAKKKYFTKIEIAIWVLSVILIVVPFIIFDRENYLSLIASLIGTSALMLNAKGNALGQILVIIFSVLYGIISFNFAYYGEMITYLGMSAPMAALALISWLRNPSQSGNMEVKVNKISAKELVFMCLLTAAVTVAFYFILAALNTTNLIVSTISVTTSFAAVYLTFRRSPYFAVAYGVNDIVLVVLWVLAAITDISYISIVMCFVVFLINDIYGFINWLRMRKRQQKSS